MSRVLVACEESQVVTIAFRNMGIEAYSCDVIPCSGNHPEWHLQCDVITLINDGWDMMIAHPPCTYLANSGVQHLRQGRNIKRMALMYEAREFFMRFIEADIKYIAVENPVPHGYAKLPKYNQIIQPYQFGHETTKRTCLWLKNLPKLEPTNIVGKGKRYIDKSGKSNGSAWYQLMSPSDR